MRRRRAHAIAIAILVGTLILTTAEPAHAAQRLRLYRGETSQGERIAFRVARTDAGRFVRRINSSFVLTCQDETTQVWGITSFVGNSVPITDGEFSFDLGFSDLAVHLQGRLGSLRGEGTLSAVVAALTEDEQAQLCTTGDLTWEVEFARIITGPRLDATERRVVRAAERPVVEV